MMNQLIGKKVLLTTQNWFYAPDGKRYNALYGELKAIHEAGKALGFIPNRSHANWFIEVGDMIIMGCQVLYLVRCDKIHDGKVTEWTFEKGMMEYERPSNIYICV